MRVDIPMLAALRATIDASPTGDLAYLVTRRGTPWNKGALGTYFSDSARAAGIKGKSAHGMRKAAAIRSALNGATEREWRPFSAGKVVAWPAYMPSLRAASGLRGRPSTR
jgi:hypothetical protein